MKVRANRMGEGPGRQPPKQEWVLYIFEEDPDLRNPETESLESLYEYRFEIQADSFADALALGIGHWFNAITKGQMQYQNGDLDIIISQDFGWLHYMVMLNTTLGVFLKSQIDWQFIDEAWEVFKIEYYKIHPPKAPAAKCPLCIQPIGEFKDALSAREYSISGLCQKCQDNFLGPSKK